MILLVITDTQLLVTTPYTTPGMHNTHNLYTLESNQFCFLCLFNSTWLRNTIDHCASAIKQTQAQTHVSIALGGASLQEFWQDTAPSAQASTDTSYYLQEQALFDKIYYACLRYDQIIQYQLVCLPTHTLVCLTTLSIAWYYAYRLYYPTESISASSLSEIQQALCAPSHLQQAGTQCPLVYAGIGLAHLASYYHK
jgi:hypothetical protein